jgi:hypothetical protein
LLGPEEWWVRDLADKLGVSYHGFKDWVKKGYVHFRKIARRWKLVSGPMRRSESASVSSGITRALAGRTATQMS